MKTRDFDIDTILSEKKGIIRKSGIQTYQTDEQFSDVGGLEVLKGWLSKRKAAFYRDARLWPSSPQGSALSWCAGL